MITACVRPTCRRILITCHVSEAPEVTHINLRDAAAVKRGYQISNNHGLATSWAKGSHPGAAAASLVSLQMGRQGRAARSSRCGPPRAPSPRHGGSHLHVPAEGGLTRTRRACTVSDRAPRLRARATSRQRKESHDLYHWNTLPEIWDMTYWACKLIPVNRWEDERLSVERTT